MAVEDIKKLVGEFSTHFYVEDGKTYGQVIRKKKVLFTVSQASLVSLHYWTGEAKNRQGKFKDRTRSTEWNFDGVDLQSRVDELLRRSVASAILEKAS